LNRQYEILSTKDTKSAKKLHAAMKRFLARPIFAFSSFVLFAFFVEPRSGFMQPARA